MKKSMRAITPLHMNMRILFLVVAITTMVPVAIGVDVSNFHDEKKLSDSTHLDEYSTITNYQTRKYVLRRLEDSSGSLQSEGADTGDFLILLGFVLFVLALAYPVNVLTCCRSLQQRILQCCCCVKPPRDTPPSEVDILDGPTSDYKLVTQISSTSMSTGSDVDVVDMVTDVA